MRISAPDKEGKAYAADQANEQGVKIRRGNAGGKRFHSKEARPTA